MRLWGSYHRVSSLIAVVAASLFAQGQTPAATGAGKGPEVFGKRANRPIKLTLKQQRGLRLLKAVESEASALEPEMSAFVLWKVSKGYTVIDRSRADRSLQRAFLATQSMEEGPDDESSCQESHDCRTKSWLQTGLLNEIMQRHPELAEQLLPQGDPLPRKQATATLAGVYVKRKDFLHAEALLISVADEENYPFDVATDLLIALPKDSPELLTVLSQALWNFQQHDQNPALNDFPDHASSILASSAARYSPRAG
jgi:hypothetical protein